MAEEKPASNGRPTSRGAARQVFGDVLNEKLSQEKVGELVDAILQLKGQQWGYCPECRKTLQLEVKDYAKIVSSAIALLEQAEGRPSAEEAGGLTIIVRRPAYEPADGD